MLANPFVIFFWLFSCKAWQLRKVWIFFYKTLPYRDWLKMGMNWKMAPYPKNIEIFKKTFLHSCYSFHRTFQWYMIFSGCCDLDNNFWLKTVSAYTTNVYISLTTLIRQNYNRTTVLVVLRTKINTIKYNCLLFWIQIPDVNDM